MKSLIVNLLGGVRLDYAVAKSFGLECSLTINPLCRHAAARRHALLRRRQTGLASRYPEKHHEIRINIQTEQLTGRARDVAVSQALGHGPTFDMQSHGRTWSGW